MASPLSNCSEDDDPLPISALQHWLFCRRQCCLIHIERSWQENRFTAEGRVLHERVDDGRAESRDGIRVLRSLPMRSERLGVAGVGDVVELRKGVPRPVEYKRGKPKRHSADEVQLCAQAMCLEEMFGCEVAEGDLFYGQTRRRTTVVFSPDLRALTARTASEARAAIASGVTPPPVFEARKCGACSMAGLCLPQRLEETPQVENWLRARLHGAS